MRSELDDAKKEMAKIQSQLTDSNCEMKYCKHSCNELIAENKSLKLHTNKLDNYSRRMNIIIRGIDDSKEETNDQCVHKVYDFLKNQLKLDDGTVDRIKFAGCHRLSVSTNRNRREHHQQMKRPIIVQFFNAADKATVWGAKFHISDSGVSISENFSADTEYNRNKLYMLYKKAKSMDRYKQKVHLVGDVLILDGKRYGVDELHNLPVELSPRQFRRGSMMSSIFLVGFIVHRPHSATGSDAKSSMKVTHSNQLSKHINMLRHATWMIVTVLIN